MEQKIREGHENGLSDLAIADQLGVSWRRVQRIRYSLGLYKRTRRVKALDSEIIVSMIKDGISDKVVARVVGCSLSTVVRCRHKQGIYIKKRQDNEKIFDYHGELKSWLASIRPQHVPESEYREWLKTPVGQEFLEVHMNAEKRADDYPKHQRRNYGEAV